MAEWWFEFGHLVELVELKINPTPNLDLEQELFRSGVNLVAGVDEVGRGSLAGPVTVGVAVIDSQVSVIPAKLRDSKLISKVTRQNLIPILNDWVKASAVGHTSAQEIDQIGITAALRLAWQRAFDQLSIKPDHVILDGKHNWLVSATDSHPSQEIPITMKIKADQHCAVVSAASVLAKVERDNLMISADQDYPNYGFASNVGYGSANHMSAIRKYGASEFHRRSWNLPTS